MKWQVPDLNLVLAWVWIVLRFASGLVLGLNFHRPDWLGGYASFRRRLYRLGHVSFFGLGAVNLLFYFTARTLPDSSAGVAVAAWAFAAGTVTMPVCCLPTAHWPRARFLFAAPVTSLLLAGAAILWEVL